MASNGNETSVGSKRKHKESGGERCCHIHVIPTAQVHVTISIKDSYVNCHMSIDSISPQ